MDPTTERAQQADPPVAELVAEALDDHRPVTGQRTGRFPLVGEVGRQIARRTLVQGVVAFESLDRRLRGHGLQLPQE